MSRTSGKDYLNEICLNYAYQGGEGGYNLHFSIFCLKFSGYAQMCILHLKWGWMFDLGLGKDVAAKFFLRPKSKICPHLKCEMHFYAYPENYR